MKVFQITLFCLCILVSSANIVKHPCIPNPCTHGTCYPLANGSHWCRAGCYYNGMVYKIGGEFWIDCNLCICHPKGMISCTERDCNYCKYKGKSFKPGSVIKIACVTCHCINRHWVCNSINCEEANVELLQQG